jgi:LEA14-like dessication related protein
MVTVRILTNKLVSIFKSFERFIIYMLKGIKVWRPISPKAFTIILILVFLLNILFVSYLSALLQTIKTPETHLEINLLEVNSIEALINSKLYMTNPNDFEIILQNLELSTTMPDGQLVAHLHVKEEHILPKQYIEFSKNVSVNFHGQNPETLNTRVTGEIGINVGLLHTTLLLSLSVVTNMMELLNDVEGPIVDSYLSYGEITQENINISLHLDVYNPNSFDLDIKDIMVTFSKENHEPVGYLNFPDLTLSAKSNIQCNGTGTLAIDIFNAQHLLINITMAIDVIIAGFIKNSILSITSTIDIPDLNDLIPSTFPTDTVIRGDYRPTLRGFIDDITLEVRNPNNIEFTAKDIQVQIYRIDRGTRRLIGNGTIEDGLIQANTVTQLSGDILIPYRKFFIPPWGGKLIPDWLEIDIRANISVKGLQNYLWVGMIGYQDLHLFRSDPWIMDAADLSYE